MTVTLRADALSEAYQRHASRRGKTRKRSAMWSKKVAGGPDPLFLGPYQVEKANDPNNRFEIQTAMEFFVKNEFRCDDLIQRQDEIIRRVALRTSQESNDKGTECLDPDLALGLLPKVSGHAKDRVAEAWGRDLVPLVSGDFATAAAPEDLDAIEELEFEILDVRRLMSEIELAILSHVPLTPKDMVLKMKFMAGLVIDGAEVDIEAFAWLADDVAKSLLLGFDEFSPKVNV